MGNSLIERIIIMKHLINVKEKDSGKDLCQIKRQLRGRVWGNFNPIFCTYKGKEYLVQSTHGDLSDPFRRTEDYLTGLYIEC